MVHVSRTADNRYHSALVGSRCSEHPHNIPVLVRHQARVPGVRKPVAGPSSQLLCKHRCLFTVDLAVLTGSTHLEGLLNVGVGCGSLRVASDPVVNLCLYATRSYFTSSTP